MDWMLVLAVAAGLGVYLIQKSRRGPVQGPLAAQEVRVDDVLPEALRSLIRSQPRSKVKCLLTTLSSGEALAFGYTPGNDRIDVFAPTGESDLWEKREFSLAQRIWTAGEPSGDPEIHDIIQDTFPG